MRADVPTIPKCVAQKILQFKTIREPRALWGMHSALHFLWNTLNVALPLYGIRSTWHFHCMEYVQLGTSTVWNTFNLALPVAHTQRCTPSGIHSVWYFLGDALHFALSWVSTTLGTPLDVHYTWHSLRKNTINMAFPWNHTQCGTRPLGIHSASHSCGIHSAWYSLK